MARFADVLTIINGKNQKKVENPNGKYPIYGSGGIMGYADDYICEANTVIIGRKGSINNPLFVKTRFWNVDTAFGLCADPGKLQPKYLYYFCEKFDFEQLNTTVTIPSLTRANLLKVEIPLPPFDEQRKIAAVLDKVSDLIAKRRQQLDKLEELYKTYGYCLNTLHSYEFDGSAGFAKMQSIMQAFRGDIKVFGGKKVVKLLDYAPGLDGLPKSDVLKFLLEDNCSIVVRPSGTEPKLKTYISVSAENKETAEIVEADIRKSAEKYLK